MIQIAEPITLEQLLPLIKQLSKVLSANNCVNPLKPTRRHGGKNGKVSSPTSTMPLPTHQRMK